MTQREIQLQYCQICQNRSFDPKHGIICGLTDEKATFELTCPDFKQDEKETTIIEATQKREKKEDLKKVNNARVTLFVIGGFYIIIGFVEAYIIAGHELLFGIVDWVIAGFFIGLGILSQKHPFVAILSGLILYVFIVLLLFLVEPTSLLQGIIWKIAILYYLIMGVKTARQTQLAEDKKNTADLLDSDF
jgi:predicted MFS family arabinose efflux permease